MGELIMLESKLKIKLAEANMSNTELAQRLGVSKQTITNWKNGHNNPPIETAFKIAYILHCKVDDLFVYIDDEE